MPLSDQKKPDPLSKSQVKRDMLALQDLGKALVALPKAQLVKIPLPDELREAIYFAQNLKANESKRRQLQYIGKLMRAVDPEPIHAALDSFRMALKVTISRFHKAEQWRDQLIAEGDLALQKFLELCPQADSQHLRQLVRNTQRDRAKNKASGAEKELFKYLRDLLGDSDS